ncbi:MAG: hypothetical protein R3D84_15320 [Paracoccaceae bacterium]
MIVLHVFAVPAFLLAPHLGEATVEIGEVDEVLTDNAQLARSRRALGTGSRTSRCSMVKPRGWSPPSRPSAEQLMVVAQRAETAPRLAPFTGASWRSRPTG